MILVLQNVRIFATESLIMDLAANLISSIKNQVDEATMALMKGYIRKTEQEVEKIIPPIIVYTCIMFYWMKEFFKIHGDTVTLSDDRLAVTLSSDTSNLKNACFGAQLITSIDKVRHKWTLQIKQWAPYGLIGVSDKTRTDTAFIWDKEAHYYGLGIKMQRTMRKNEDGTMNLKHPVQFPDIDSQFTLILDLNRQQILLGGNEQDVTVYFDNIACREDIHYRLAVSFGNKGDGIEIINYTAEYY